MGVRRVTLVAIPRLKPSQKRRKSSRREVPAARVLDAIVRGVSNRTARRRCEFSPSGTFLSPVEPGIVRMSSTGGGRSIAHSVDRLEAKDFARTESRIENTVTVYRGAVADRLGALIRNFASTRMAAMSEVRDAHKAARNASPSCVRARFRARDGPRSEFR
jgi:hypothetical protein